MKPLITVFTPTYNRAHTLSILFESLKDQNFSDFEWLIVDDGSKDSTKVLVEDFEQENSFPIHYVEQENQGKHIAINTGIKAANGNYFVVVDSDDFLLENALYTMKELISEIDSKPEFAGFTYIHFQKNTPYNPEKYGKKTWTQEVNYVWEFSGEMGYCYKTDILKKFPFPKFDGEKFCPESLIHNRIGNEYKVLYTDTVLASGEYLEDGLSAKFTNLLEQNPRSAMLLYSDKLNGKHFTNEQKQSFVKNYWNIALKSKNISWSEKFSGISLSWSFWFWKNRLFK